MNTKIKVPEGMLQEAFDRWDRFPGTDFGTDALEECLASALEWLNDNILDENNADFHKAILKRGFERYSDDPTQRVAFEFGVSFGRHYLRQMFEAKQEPEGFVECDTCRAKLGSPFLCSGCLHNRAVIERLNMEKL